MPALEGGSATAGVLTVWGERPSEEGLLEDDDWYDEYDDSGIEGIGVPRDEAAETGFDRAVLYGIYEANSWRSRISLAAADGESLRGAYGSELRYSPPGWQLELKQSCKGSGFSRPEAVAKVSRQGSVARANGRLGAKLAVRQESEGDGAATTNWSVIVSGRQGISAARIGSLYTVRQVQRVKSPAWRISAEWSLTSDDTVGWEYPWLWSDPQVKRWVGSAEGLLPVGPAGLGVRLTVAEAKNGRLNWSYPLFGPGRALTSQSHSALKAEALLAVEYGRGWRFLSEILVAEEVKHDESLRGSYFALMPSLERDLAKHVKLTVSAGWLRVQEYSGEHVEEIVQLLRLSISL